MNEETGISEAEEVSLKDRLGDAYDALSELLDAETMEPSRQEEVFGSAQRALSEAVPGLEWPEEIDGQRVKDPDEFVAIGTVYSGGRPVFTMSLEVRPAGVRLNPYFDIHREAPRDANVTFIGASDFTEDRIRGFADQLSERLQDELQKTEAALEDMRTFSAVLGL